MIVHLTIFLRFWSNSGYQKSHKTLDFSSLHKLFLAIANQKKKGWGRQREKRGEKREERERERRFQVLQQG